MQITYVAEVPFPLNPVDPPLPKLLGHFQEVLKGVVNFLLFVLAWFEKDWTNTNTGQEKKKLLGHQFPSFLTTPLRHFI